MCRLSQIIQGLIHLGKFIILTILDKQDDLPADYKDGHKITLMDVVKSVSFGDMRFLTQVFILTSTFTSGGVRVLRR